MNDWHSLSKKEVFGKLDSSEKGLTKSEAEKRLKTYGHNKIKKTHRLEPLKIFFEQFKSFLIYILIFAAVVSFLIGAFTDAVVIGIIVFLNSGIGFFQQYKAEKAIKGLQKLLVPTSIVIREGVYARVPSTEVVPGDILVLNAGDKINADCRVIELENLQTNEAILTGESLPVTKIDQETSPKTILAERVNMLYTGTEVVRGSAKAIVVATGMKTEFGKIAKELQQIQIQKSPMQKRLDRFSKQIGFIIIGIVVIIMLLGFLEHFDKLEMFLTAVALAVSSIPEGLPAVLAISFAISSIFMSKKNVIIRKLPAVESLGSVTIICSDKTGTLTEEQMDVQSIFANNQSYTKKGKSIFLKNKKIELSKELEQLIKIGVLCNNARFEKVQETYNFVGDPTEEALLRLGLDFGVNKKTLSSEEPRLKEFEFNAERKMMSLLRDSERNNILYTKGASEKILAKSSFELINGQVKELTEKRKKELLAESANMEEKALRVLGFAYRNIPKKVVAKEDGLIFVGFVGMIDPPRAEIPGAIAKTKSAGIKVKIITGDSIRTAVAIANQIGIEGEAVTGSDLDKMSDAELEAKILNIAIFARTTPEQKLRITKTLQKLGETVAITGDGINDVLALKSADVGIAMGIRGTDVARDTADVVLTDDNFNSIVAGIAEGRMTYDNIKKFTKYMLAVNFSEMFLIVVTLFARMPLPLLPLQILWLNLITDSFPALTLAFEKSEDVMNTKPRQEKSILDGILKFVILGGVVNFFACFIIYIIGLKQGMNIEAIRGMVLTTGILFELFFIYTCRSDKLLSKIGIFSNKWLNYSIVFSLGLQFLLLYTGLADIFGVAALSLNQWLLVLPFAFSGVVIFEIAKFFRK